MLWESLFTKRGLCRHAVSVRPSVCHVRVFCRNKWTCLRIFFHHRVAKPFQFFRAKPYWQYSDGGVERRLGMKTSSSAVVKKPRDVSCLSVVSFNSTKRRVESFIVIRRLQILICHCVQLNALFCCLWRNVEVSCHKHFVVVSRS